MFRLSLVALFAFFLVACIERPEPANGGGPGSNQQENTSKATVSVETVSKSVAETAGTVTVNVTRTNLLSEVVTVDYASNAGTAIVDTEFNSVSGTLTFLADETSKAITVTIINDNDYEADKTFAVVLSNASANASIQNNTTTITITNDDPAPVSCLAADLDLAWPFGGLEGVDWVVQNHFDHDDTTGLADYMGGTKTYDGHKGVDINVSSFREMDANTPIYAAAAGEVIAKADGNFDRQTSWVTYDWNYITVKHANGYTLTYGHFQQNSITVNVGDVITQGQHIGNVGSSGWSSGPHLHFELKDCSNVSVDPFQLAVWASPPVYNTSIALMDYMVFNYALGTFEDMKDPPPNATTVSTSAAVTGGMTIAGGAVGDTIRVEFIKPDSSVWFAGNASYTQNYVDKAGLYYWYWWTTVDSTTGTWQIKWFINGVEKASHNFTVQ
ncbi:MAG: peptidoglycan DD-metalloendopeptidase family protein [Gammaproteobacteria bacterium]|nr:peptidoglycan DD-metalloendopeptidase family protein [Gammaproteobacteria bacterium]MDH5692277.1 peptidoglycan DD-metalloendopeptidase family protein [Gammaproteobacteria bacterium]